MIKVAACCLLLVLVCGEEPSSEASAKKPSIIHQKEIKRPTLKYGSFGFSHAKHLSSGYSGNYTLNIEELVGNNSIHDAPFLHSTAADDINSRSSLQSPISDENKACKKINTNCGNNNGGFRTADGSCNNLHMPFWGMSETSYRRILHKNPALTGISSQCSDGELGSRHLPNPRLASRLLVERISEKNSKDNIRDQSIFTVIWGQVLDHDLLLTPLRQTAEGEFLDCCDPANHDANDCCSIKAPEGDFFYGREKVPKCIPFIRSKLTDQIPERCFRNSRRHHSSKGRSRVRDVENTNTHFLDASHLYGSDADTANRLRTFEDGKLKATIDNTGRSWPPLVTEGDAIRMDFGDTRGDVHPGFTLLVTLGIRYHNKIAEQLKELRPDWNDERLYQESRKIVIAVKQHITYTQWMDSLLGRFNNIRTNDRMLHQDFYSPKIDPSISMIFSTAAFRLHTLVPGSLHLRTPDYQFEGEFRLRDSFHQPLKLLANNTFDDLIRGMALQPAWSFNNIFSHEMTEWLFAEENNGTFGMDIVSLNIQRGRDHQIQGYPAYREACGLGSGDNWNKLTDFIPHNMVHRLLHIYRSPEEVDMYIGANMESTMKGSLLGPTTHCLVEEQFERTRNGDRHFYTRPSEFTRKQLASIKRGGSLSHVLCAIAHNPEELFLPRNLFRRSRRGNPIVQCSRLPMIDLRPWQTIA